MKQQSQNTPERD